MTPSATPVTVIVCRTFQLPEVKVRLAGETVPALELLEESPTVTSVVGWEVRTTLKVAVPPDSVVTSPVVGVTRTPATMPTRVTSAGS